MTTILNPEQLVAWQAQGYLVLRDAFDLRAIAALRDAAAGIIADFDADRHRTIFSTTDRDAGRDDYFFNSAQAVHCFLEEGAVDPEGRLNRPRELAINKIGHAMHNLVPGFAGFCRQVLIGAVLRELGMADPVLWQSMYIFKQPGIGGEVRWHQDASYLLTRPPAVIGMWVAVEDATLDNGCLWMAPGEHRSPLREVYEVDWSRRRGKLSTLDTTPWPGPDQARALPVRAGSLVVFSDLMPHYSAVNRSALSRQAFTMHFSASDADWSAGNWLQRPDLGQFRV